jgi:hypothetical protein
MSIDALKLTDGMTEYNQHMVLAESLLYCQAALNLTGRSEDSLLLQRDAIADLNMILFK